MNRFRVIFFCLILCPFQIAAQELSADPLEELTADLKARTEPRYDVNGNECALIRVLIPTLQNLKFKGRPGIIGDVLSQPGEYDVYVPENTNKLTILHSDFLPCTVEFPKVKGKTVYRLVLRVPENSSSNTIVRLRTNVQKATLSIGGQTFTTDNAEFHFPLGAGEYDYSVSTNIQGFSTFNGHVSISGKDIVCELPDAKLVSEEQRSLTIYCDKGAEIKIDGELQKQKNNGMLTVTVPAGIHTVETKLGTSGNWYKKREKDLSEKSDSINMLMRGAVRITSPLNAEFVFEPIGESIAPERKSVKTGETLQLLGSYNVKAKKKGYNETSMRVNVGVEDQLLNTRIAMTSEADNLFFGLKGKKMDKVKACKLYEKAAKAGDDQAMYRLGMSEQEKGNVQGAIQHWKTAAALNNEDAMMAICHNSASPIEQAEYAKKAAELGNEEAMLLTADYLMTKQNLGEAFTWYEKAYSHGKIEAAVPLGDFFFNGWGMSKDYVKAHRYFAEAMAEGIQAAKERLADFAYYGINQDKDQPAALKVYNQLWQTKTASDGSLYKLAVYFYKKGDYMHVHQALQDIKQLDYLVNETALGGFEFEKMANTLFETNPSQSLDFYITAVRKGLDKAIVYDRIGQLYYKGRGTAKDLNQAISWLEKASMSGSGEGSCFLGAAYQDQQLYPQALKAFNTSVKQGYVNANGYIGTMYSKGLGVKKNLDSAVSYWAKAAANGHQPSIKNLIKYYEFKKNAAEANRWRVLLK